MRTATRTIMLLSALALLATAAVGQSQRNPNPGVVPPHADTHGMSYGQWAGAWWNWALQYPPDLCPVVDPDGTLAHNGQSGPVFFLAGTFGANAERWVTIPPGKTLFFPLFNGCWWVPEDGATEALVRAGVNAQINSCTSLTCSVDGKDLKDLWAYRAQSPAGGFSLNIPDGSISQVWWGYDPGVRTPAVADGYWLMLTPLPPGLHTIRFTSAASYGFELEVVYHLTVLPGKP